MVFILVSLQLELIDVRTHVLGFNGGFIHNLMFYTFLLLGCRLFLREDEVAGLAYSSIAPEATVVKNGVLVQLGLKVKGKNDVEFKILVLHRDDAVPELCPIRPFDIFNFIWASGISKMDISFGSLRMRRTFQYLMRLCSTRMYRFT